MNWFIGNWQHLGGVVGKAVLMYAVAMVGLRAGERRTLAQWRIIDFVAAVAIGAVVGRTAIASTQSFITGAVALVALLVMHRLASGLRRFPTMRRVFDHPLRILVHDGALRDGELRRCGINEDDVSSHLRQQGIGDLNEVKYLIYEATGQLTIVRNDTASTPLVEEALDRSAGFHA
ncbi:DUF421 domain-containing protein [Leekyejoonella antrihumi]|uniref:DUF421 domain-containing protein n=1 Tax=Leekyejoonella antrihumi TaxID=1660198 RepID=A0A563E5Z3_9MICO|nr:YetF domain-containing protein [Leekyejoonella antrihumi]TWP37937.1 DUF421 domain-containing protein [Leekyejoonella antrihumi]